MVSLQAKILWYLFIQVNLNLSFPFHALFRDRKKPASSLQAIGMSDNFFKQYLLFYFFLHRCYRSKLNSGLNLLFNLGSSGCKESQFYSLPFSQAVASMY